MQHTKYTFFINYNKKLPHTDLTESIFYVHMYLYGVLHDEAAASVVGKAFHKKDEDIRTSSWASAGTLCDAGVQNRANMKQLAGGQDRNCFLLL